MNEKSNNKISPSRLESEVGEKLSQLLFDLDFKVDFVDNNPRQGAPDFVAKKVLNSTKDYRIAIELKSNSNFVDAIKYGTRTLEKVKTQKQFDKLLLVLFNSLSASYESSPIYQDLKRNNPTDIEIITLYDLDKWVNNLKKVLSTEEINEVHVLIRQLSRKFISLIAKNPDYLLSLEWRDLERTITELFNEIGFNATLTPGSKDGSKDVILECEIDNEKKTYIIEIKHWCSGQKVGQKAVKEFTQVIINEKRTKGLYLSTFGYTGNYLESLTKVERSKINFGEKEKIVELCETYEKIKNGIWIPVPMDNLLFDNTN